MHYGAILKHCANLLEPYRAVVLSALPSRRLRQVRTEPDSPVSRTSAVSSPLSSRRRKMAIA